MIFKETKLKGAWIIQPEKMQDERGFFARTFCKVEFETYGLSTSFVQCNISFNKEKGTLRGMHYQAQPYQEVKTVHCTKGAIFDVIIDLRIESPTFKQWVGVELSADDHCMLYIPAGFAHGFQTLMNNSEVFYQISEFYHPECARGIRWDDPSIGISWPMEEIRIISERDQNFLLLKGMR